MKMNKVWLTSPLYHRWNVALASWALVLDRVGLAQPTPEGKKQQAQVGTLEDAKLKGFEGVDFSYVCSARLPARTPRKLPRRS